MNDRQLIENLRAKDENAFRWLVDKYQLMVVKTCNGFLHNQNDAQDVAQEVFIEVYRSIHKFRGDSRISTWLYRIAVNKSLNYIRDNKQLKWIRRIIPIGHDKQPELENLSASETDTSDYNITNSEKRYFLHKALNSLPENQKIAFTLHKYEDLPYKEIADIMDVSLSAVESLIHRAKKNLQQRLINYYKKNLY